MTVRVRDVVAYSLAPKPPSVKVHDAVVYGATPKLPSVKVHDAVVYGATPMVARSAVADATAVILTPDDRVASIYDVSAVALVSDPTPPVSRNVVINALARDTAQVPNWTLKGNDWLKTLLAKEYGGSWATSDLVFSDPQVRTTGQFNTDAQLAVPRGSKVPYSGKMRMKYHRWSLARAFESKTPGDLRSFGSSVFDSLSVINSTFGLALTTDDVVDAPISSGATQITLTIASGSLMYLPGSSVVLGGGALMSSNMSSLDLDGFDPA